jgi:hypothetical protein
MGEREGCWLGISVLGRLTISEFCLLREGVIWEAFG